MHGPRHWKLQVSYGEKYRDRGEKARLIVPEELRNYHDLAKRCGVDEYVAWISDVAHIRISAAD